MALLGPADYEGCTELAVDAFTNKVFWVGLGRTTEWPDPNNPPAQDRAIRQLQEPICWAVPSQISLCVPVAENGDITVGGQQYQFVAVEDAFDLFARFIYLRAVFDVDLNPDLPYADWRQAMVVTNLVPLSGHENDQWLAPINVQSRGRVWQHVNVTRKGFGPGSPTTIETVLRFP